MKESKYLDVISDGTVNNVVFLPTGEVLLKWVFCRRATMMQNMKLTNDIIKVYDDYIRAICK